LFRRSKNFCRASSSTGKEIAEEDVREDVDVDENNDEVEEKEAGEVDVREGLPGRAPPDVDAAVSAGADAPPPDTAPPSVPSSLPDWCDFDPVTTNENTEVNEADEDEGEKDGGDR
jgi:hypothetical protein